MAQPSWVDTQMVWCLFSGMRTVSMQLPSSMTKRNLSVPSTERETVLTEKRLRYASAARRSRSACGRSVMLSKEGAPAAYIHRMIWRAR